MRINFTEPAALDLQPALATQTCRTCAQVLPLTEFHRGARFKSGYVNQCKACNSKADAARYAADLEGSRAKNRARRAANLDRYRETQRNWAAANYPTVGKERRKAKYWADPEKARQATKDFRAKYPWASLIVKAKSRSSEKGLAFDLTNDWGEATWTGKCAVTGAPFQPERGRKWSASIDKIDPSKGYVQSNCRFVLWIVNVFKSDGTDADMIEVAKLIARNAHE